MRMHIKGRWLFSVFKLRGSGSYPLPLEGERPKGKGLARAKHNDFEALLIFMCCTDPFEPVELLLHAIEGSYVLRVIPEPIHLNPEPSVLSYYMTTEEI